LRRSRVIPREFTDRFLERLSSGKLDRERALELCRAHESPAGRIFALVVSAWGQPGATIRQTLSYDSGGEVVELKRNLRILSAMATLGPLLGLLGTVVGIIQSFDALGGRVGPARGEALAHGISLALVATALGLAIAIIAVAFYYFFLNRVDLLVRELDERTRQVIELVASESQRLPATDRRHVPPLRTPETQRHESRVI
jgi:biopolymer transport protein ExbB